MGLFVRYWSIHHSGWTHCYWGRCWKQVRHLIFKKKVDLSLKWCVMFTCIYGRPHLVFQFFPQQQQHWKGMLCRCTDTHLHTFFTVALCLSSSLILKSFFILLLVRICLCVRESPDLSFYIVEQSTGCHRAATRTKQWRVWKLCWGGWYYLSFDMVLQMVLWFSMTSPWGR